MIQGQQNVCDVCVGVDDLHLLPDVGSFWYVATPYSQYPGGIDNAYSDACRVSGVLIQAGLKIYCPIAHTHPIAIYSGIDPLAHEIWLPVDKPLMDAAGGILVVKMPSWERSRGIGFEIREFELAGKPVYGLEWW